MSKEDLKLVVSIARTYNSLINAIEKNMNQHKLNLSEFGVLECLLHKGDQPVQKLAEKILVTSGTITYVIDKLQRKGYVVRQQCEKDKRIYYVSLTSAGETVIKEIFKEHERFLEELFQSLSKYEKEDLISKLIHVQIAMSAVTQEGLGGLTI